MSPLILTQATLSSTRCKKTFQKNNSGKNHHFSPEFFYKCFLKEAANPPTVQKERLSIPKPI
jgi:hypothetical protein